MSFRDQSWNARFEKMGDQAEDAFELVMRKEKRGFLRYGLNRPPLQVHKLPLRIRYQPDYLTTKCLVECQGFGNDQVLKLKVEKLDCMQWWNTVHPLELFVWDSKNERHWFVSMEKLAELRDHAYVRLDWFPENKAYFAIAAEVLGEAA
jgi:hypothetical protein